MIEELENQVERGTSLHNRLINKTGTVLSVNDDKTVNVLTVSGKDKWSVDDCDVVLSN